MNVLSAFDGISCAQIALERAKIKVDQYFASETDKYAIRVTQSNYPNTKQIGDITKIDIDKLPKIHLLIGGSPCQGLSIAGSGKGFNDPRSKLFYSFVDVLQAINPKYFLLENVRMSQSNCKIINECLGVEPIMINSSLVSAQSRKRLYWTNIPNVKQPKDKKILLKDIIENGSVDRDKSYCIDACYYKGTSIDNYYNKKRRQCVIIGPDKLNPSHIRMLTPLECERLQTLPDGYTDKGVSNTQRYKMIGNGFTVDVIAHILSYIPEKH